MIHPQQVTGDFNNGSIVLRLVYGDVKVLLTGDAEAPAEHEMIVAATTFPPTFCRSAITARGRPALEFLEAVNRKPPFTPPARTTPTGIPTPR